MEPIVPRSDSRRRPLDVDTGGGVSAMVRVDATWLSMESERTEAMVDAEGDERRLRLALKCEHRFDFGKAASIGPRFEVRLRHDGDGALRDLNLPQLDCRRHLSRGPKLHTSSRFGVGEDSGKRPRCL